MLAAGACLLLLALIASGVDDSAIPASEAGGSTGAAVFEPAAASFISPKRGWVLGRGGCSDCAALRVTRDGGRHWAPLPSLRVPLWYDKARSGAVSDVTFADARNGFLFGPGLLITHDGGRSWRRQSLPPVLDVGVGAGHAFALTQAKPHGHVALWRMPVGHDRWSRLPLPAGAASRSSGNVYSADLAVEGASVVLLRPGFTGPSVARPRNMAGRIWASTDSGTSWRARAVPCTASDGGAALLAIAHGHPSKWLVDCFDNEQSSQEQNTQHHLYRSVDGGASWKRISDPTRHNMPALLAGNGAGDILLATDGIADTLVGSLDGGRHWKLLLHSGGSFFGWADLRFLTAKTGFVVGPTHYAPEHLYRTDDGGRTWRILRAT